jgi:large subunit ribosomal protein L10
MPNLLNIAITEEYERLLGGNDDALFVAPIGMTVAEVNAFRSKLAEHNLRMQVLRGSLARRVLEARGLSNVGPIFEGPAAVITAANGEAVEDLPIAAAKLVAEWRKKSGIDLPAIKAGLLEGSMLGAEESARLEKMPGRRELRARIAGQILAPAGRLASQLVAGGAAIAGAVKTHIANLEEQAG